MEQLIIQIISGAVGGNAAGAMLKNLSLGSLGNTIAGALGGLGGGAALGGLLTSGAAAADAATGGGFDIGSLIGNVAGGGIGGIVVTAIVGMIKNAVAK